MPSVVGLALSAAVEYFGGLAAVAAYGSAISFASYAIVVGAYYAYGTAQARSARNAARSSFNDSLKDRLVMQSLTDAPRSRVYGRVRNVDGVLFKSTHGARKEYYSFLNAEPTDRSWL